MATYINDKLYSSERTYHPEIVIKQDPFVELNNLIYNSLSRGLDSLVKGFKETPIYRTVIDDVVIPTTYFTKRKRAKEKQKKEKKMAKKRQEKAERMVSSGNSDYAVKTQDGNKEFWEKNPHNTKPEPEYRPRSYNSWW